MRGLGIYEGSSVGRTPMMSRHGGGLPATVSIVEMSWRRETALTCGPKVVVARSVVLGSQRERGERGAAAWLLG